MNTPQIKNEKGFTIIEVVLVLAIAGLIFLMVFVALPALQRGQRDAQRKQDIARVSTQLTNYLSSTRGAVPNSPTSLGMFVKGYLGGNTDGTAGEEYTDPNGNPYKLRNETEPTEVGQVGYWGKYSCKEDGSGSTERTGANRDFAIQVKLENQDAPYCVDNKS